MSTVYFGGRILSMEHPDDRPEAVWVDKGIICAAGELQTVLKQAGKRPKLVDLKGKCLMPAFIDPHSHVTLNGQMSLMADLSECKDFADVEKVMKDFIAENKINGKGIAIGRGYDQNFLREEEHPGKAVLDKVSTTVPVVVLHVSGHMACVNTAMLNLAGINSSTPDPKGGKYGRVPGTNEPDGLLQEGAMMAATQFLKKRMKVNIMKMLDGMQQAYIENGVTTTQEGAGDPGNFKLLQLAQLLGKLKMDVVFYPVMGEATEKFIHERAADVGRYRKHIKIGGYKMVLDGSPQGRTAWMSEPYLGGEEGYCAFPWLSDEECDRNAKTAVDEGRQLLVHCNGDAASEQFLNAYEKALEESSNPNKMALRPVMIHCQTVRNDQLDRMAKIDMIPSIFVGHVYYWGDIHMKNFGPVRGHHISPVRDALDRGMLINFHQDTPITKPNMLHSVWTAVNRISRGGNVIGEDQKIGVYDALKAVTINAAYQYFEEDSKGSIRAGKRADLVILDKDPTEVDPMEIKDIKVLETIKDGKTIYKR